jgi:hypothetical protein
VSAITLMTGHINQISNLPVASTVFSLCGFRPILHQFMQMAPKAPVVPHMNAFRDAHRGFQPADWSYCVRRANLSKDRDAKLPG